MRELLLLILLSAPLLAGLKGEVYSGTIHSAEEDFCVKSVGYVLQAALATELYGNLVLVLAPKWYLLRLKLAVKIGDKVEVHVLRQTDGKFHVLTLKSKGKTFRLRDANGKPLWKADPGSEDLFKTFCKT